ncbi:hypothetical protein RJZ56_004776 [Blastomyces dermatitidis]
MWNGGYIHTQNLDIRDPVAIANDGKADQELEQKIKQQKLEQPPRPRKGLAVASYLARSLLRYVYGVDQQPNKDRDQQLSTAERGSLCLSDRFGSDGG